MILFKKAYRKGVLETLNLLYLKLPPKEFELFSGYGSDLIGKPYIVYFDKKSREFKAMKL